MPLLDVLVYEGDTPVSEALALPVRRTATGFAGLEYRGRVFEIYAHRYGRPAIDLKCQSWIANDGVFPIVSELPPFRDGHISDAIVDQSQPQQVCSDGFGFSSGHSYLDSSLLAALLRVNLSVRAKNVLGELSLYTRWQRMTLAEYLEDPPPLEGIGDVRTSVELRRAIKRLHKLSLTRSENTSLEIPSARDKPRVRTMPDVSISASDVAQESVTESNGREVIAKPLEVVAGEIVVGPQRFAPRRMLRIFNELPTHIDPRGGKRVLQFAVSTQTELIDESESEAESSGDCEPLFVTGIRLACVNLFDFGCHLRALYECPEAKKVGMYQWVDRICTVAATIHLTAIEDPDEILRATTSVRCSAAVDELTYLVDAGSIGDEPFNSFCKYPEAVAGEIRLLDGLTSYWARQLVDRAVKLRSLLEGGAQAGDYKDLDG